MLDFCVTIPCGIIIMAGGVIGFLVAGSTASLVAGGGCGGLLTLLGYGGYMEYKRRGTVSKLWTTASLVISNAISIMMVKRIRKTGNIMPSGPVAILGMGMTMFYLYRLKKARAVKKKD